MLAALIAAAITTQAQPITVEFTRYEEPDPTAEQNAAYEAGDRQRLIGLLPVADRVAVQMSDGQTRSFAGDILNGQATLEIDGLGYLLNFDTGSYTAVSPMLLQACRPQVFKVVRSRVGGQMRITAEAVVAGRGC